MSVQEENKVFCDSLNRLITTLIRGGAQVVPRDSVQPNWLTKTNKFLEFVTVFRHKSEADTEKGVYNLRESFVKLGNKDMYSELVDGEKYNDRFLLTADDGTGGITLSVGPLTLPIGEAYTFIKEHLDEDDPFPIVVLINFLSCLSHAMLNKATEYFYLQENIRKLNGLLPKRQEPSSSNPLDMLKKFIPSNLSSIINEDSIGQMKEVFGEVTKTLESGGDVMQLFTDKMAEVMAGEGAPQQESHQEPQAIEDTPKVKVTEEEE